MQRCKAVAVVACLLAVAGAQKKREDFQTWGKVSLFRIEAALPMPKPLTSLDQFPAMDFSYALYPTASSGADGQVPGDVIRGTPTMITVQGGRFEQRSGDSNVTLEFQVLKSSLTNLPKAPGKAGLLVFSALYTGGDNGNCTGIVQLLELDKGQLKLADQISYDCRGGGSAAYDDAKRKLTIHSARYNAGDQPCCPSQFDVLEFHFDGEKVTAGDVTVE